MPVTRERFMQGMTYDQYKAQMTRNREQFDENERNVKVSAQDVEAIKKAGPLHVLVITEDWCGDAVANFPILGRLAREAGNLDLRVFLRDQNEDITEQYKNGEFKSIPVFVVFDGQLRQKAVWIERPASVTKARAEKRGAIYAGDKRFGSPDAPPDQLPEDIRGVLQAALAKMRADLKPWADSEVVRELREVIAKAA